MTEFTRIGSMKWTVKLPICSEALFSGILVDDLNDILACILHVLANEYSWALYRS